MSKRIFIPIGVVIGLAGIVLWIALTQQRGPQKLVQRQKELEQAIEKLTEPMISSIRTAAISLASQRLTQWDDRQ